MTSIFQRLVYEESDALIMSHSPSTTHPLTSNGQRRHLELSRDNSSFTVAGLPCFTQLTARLNQANGSISEEDKSGQEGTLSQCWDIIPMPVGSHHNICGLVKGIIWSKNPRATHLQHNSPLPTLCKFIESRRAELTKQRPHRPRQPSQHLLLPSA